MGIITLPTTLTDGTVPTAAQFNGDFSAIVNEFNGSIDNANIKAAAAINESKILFSATGHGHAGGTDGKLLSYMGTDGWSADTNAWVYVSATSFKITGSNVTALFPAGTRIKCTNNSTTFYGTVASSTFSTDTTVTLIANNDYSLANSAITLPYYSSAANPQGYPFWFSYTPTWSGITLGNGTSAGKFSVVGKVIEVTAYLNAGSTTTYSGSIIFNVPQNSSADNATVKYQGWVYGQTGGTTAQGYIFINGDASTQASAFEHSTSTGQTAWAAAVPMGWSTNSIFSAWIRYKFAS